MSSISFFKKKEKKSVSTWISIKSKVHNIIIILQFFFLFLTLTLLEDTLLMCRCYEEYCRSNRSYLKRQAILAGSITQPLSPPGLVDEYWVCLKLKSQEELTKFKNSNTLRVSIHYLVTIRCTFLVFTKLITWYSFCIVENTFSVFITYIRTRCELDFCTYYYDFVLWDLWGKIISVL